ncbi:ATP-binding protein [Lysobacter firmicutimachus]|uniref:ATP-binding protein n=1 Tax=Lysobacter firmicutimachus TaxID=1792846 RepID=A0AAU8MZ74_9GAMM
MVHFPLLRRLTIYNYGLYPGAKRDGVFDLEFRPGLTLVLGANGLGKTTLMTMVFRLVAGTYDFSLSEEIGTTNLEPSELSRHARRQFADRVNDGATNARAVLELSIGPHVIVIERKLDDLALTRLEIDRQELPADEKVYQTQVCKSSGLGTYSDWLLVLRTLVFFFEDRRALVWDSGAQRQLLRCLFLSPEKAAEWTKQERAILQLDSRMRNLQAAWKREQKELSKTLRKVHSESGVRAALAAAESSLAQLTTQHDALVERVEQGEDSRQRARLSSLRAQGEHDKALRELERARLFAIQSHLPTTAESMKFLFARLMTDETCLACGTHGVDHKRDALRAMLAQHRCLVCETELPGSSNHVADIGDKRLLELQNQVEATLVHSLEQARLRDEVSAAYQKASEELTECAVQRNDVQDSIQSLINQLPPDEKRTADQHAKLVAVGELVTGLRAELAVEREKFRSSLDSYREEIQTFASGIKESFARISNGFLFEDSGLSWAPDRKNVGQAGGMEPVEYPAFAVELSGSNFTGLQRRHTPSQVSESQREFIDLAFRMALIEVASPDQASTLAVDAPESSLDAVFVDKAAHVLSQFAGAGHGSRLILTSNLGAGELVPQLLRAANPPGRRMEPLIDLFGAGVPTRAMQESKQAYEKYWALLRDNVERAEEDEDA